MANLQKQFEIENEEARKRELVERWIMITVCFSAAIVILVYALLH